MKAHAILSMLVVLAAAESATEDRFQRRSPSNSVDRVTHAVHSIVAPFKSHGTVRTINSREEGGGEKKIAPTATKKESTESGRVLPKSPARKKFRESLHFHMSTSVEIFVRSATDQCKSQVGNCATRAKKVHIDEQPVGESKKRSLTYFWSTSKANWLFNFLPDTRSKVKINILEAWSVQKSTFR